MEAAIVNSGLAQPAPTTVLQPASDTIAPSQPSEPPAALVPLLADGDLTLVCRGGEQVTAHVALLRMASPAVLGDMLAQQHLAASHKPGGSDSKLVLQVT